MAKLRIIGRKDELEILNRVKKSKEAEFIAIYGRRRVGKTYLIREYFSKQGLYIETIGTKGASLSTQLEHFIKALSITFFKGIPLKTPASWDEAFALFNDQIKSIPKSKKIILFLDELPWMATKKSKLIEALDYYWNRYWSTQSNLILIVCGSAASWMLDNLIHAKGGLYNRLTKRILLEPFNLRETKEFLESRSIRMSQKQVLDLYMAIGGVPFYLKEIKKGRSASQAIDDLCFKKNGLLYSEFNNLFQSLFDQVETNLKIVREIIKARNTISRDELIRVMGHTSGGTLNKRLDELEASSFIKCFIPYGKKKRDRFYRIVDEYTLFCLKWIEPLIRSGGYPGKGGYWQKMILSPTRSNWAGYAFESICLKHTDLISQALGLDKIAYKVGKWRFVPRKGSNKKGAQIDLLFDREDDAITLCEIKYCDKLFTIDKAYSKSLIQKMDVFEAHFSTKKQIFLALITTRGVKENIYSEDLVDEEVFLEDLFL